MSKPYKFLVQASVSSSGELSFSAKDGESVRKVLNKWAGEEVNITIEVLSKKRSLRQNRYYWVVISYIVNHFKEHGVRDIGKAHMHELMKSRFNTIDIPVYAKDGSVKRYITAPTSTSDLDSDEFAEYIDRVKQFAAEELGLNIPDPDQTHFL